MTLSFDLKPIPLDMEVLPMSQSMLPQRKAIVKLIILQLLNIVWQNIDSDEGDMNCIILMAAVLI